MTAGFPLTIRTLTSEDWSAVEAIWAEGIATGYATFETEPPSWEDFDNSRRPDLAIAWERSPNCNT